MNLQDAAYVYSTYCNYCDVKNIRDNMKNADLITIVTKNGEKEKVMTIDARFFTQTYFRDLMLNGLDFELERLKRKLEEI